jgi:hypothetical protein
MSLYIVTVENAEDGIFYEEPQGFDTANEARTYASKRPIPHGHIVGVYRCDMIESYDQTSR